MPVLMAIMVFMMFVVFVMIVMIVIVTVIVILQCHNFILLSFILCLSYGCKVTAKVCNLFAK